VTLAIYAACVDALLLVSRVTGLSYRDVNALCFCVLWPLVTVGLGVACLWPRRPRG
jgi:hypothetical protein